MLPEDERRALERIEAEISTSDPTLAERLRRPVATWHLFFVLIAVTGVCAVLTGILAGSAVLTVVGIATLGVLAGERLSRRSGG